MNKLFTTIETEHREPVAGTVTGDVPDWISGSLYRNGPGMFEVGDCKYRHLFDALAMVQRFHIANKQVTYQCQMVKGEAYKRNVRANCIVVAGYGTSPVPDPCKTIFQRFLSTFKKGEPPTVNTQVNVFPRNGQMYACTESCIMNQFDPDTLDVTKQVDLTSNLNFKQTTAHPHFDSDGTMHNIGFSVVGGPHTEFVKIPPTKDGSSDFPQAEVVASIPAPGKWKMFVNYNHAFPMTENYYVYIQQPVYFNVLKLMTKQFTGLTKMDGIEEHPHEKTIIRIFDRKTGQEINKEFSYVSDYWFFFHQANAYEENGFVVFDVCAYKSFSVMKEAYCKGIADGSYEFEEAHLIRHALPLNLSADTPTGINLVNLPGVAATATRKDATTIYCTNEVVIDIALEFPMINYDRFNGRKYRFVYGSSGKNFYENLVKIDMEAKTYKVWKEESCCPSEPVFIQSPHSSDEDEGVVLSAVNNVDYDNGQQAFLLILDAKTWTERARVTFDVPRFPFDFHGIFTPQLIQTKTGKSLNLVQPDQTLHSRDLQ